MKPGATITELLLVLTILAIVATMAVPQVRRGLDIVNVRAARESAFALATRARTHAQANGGASLVIDSDSDVIEVADAAGSAVERMSANADVSVDGAASSRVALRYDAYGIGRMTSRTVRFQRGGAQATLVVSAYGRVRR